MATTARTSGVSHSWYGLILGEGGAIHYTQIMSGTLIGYARCSTDAQNLMSRPTMYRTLQPARPPRHVTLCPLTSRISHIRPIFGEYFGNPPGVLRG